MSALEKKINDTVIRLVSADLTQRRVDAIVNAANTRLQHGGGVAGAIVRAGGEVIQEESNRIGFVPVGGTAITSAGALPANYVIHTVGPQWGEGEEEKKLAQAMQSVLACAEERGFTSISVPAISAGIYGFPKDRCARILTREVRDYLQIHHGTPLRLVEFCIMDREAFVFFQQEIEAL